MSARVLVVDDIPANVKLLEARLSAEYFDVVTAVNGAQALAICERAECDVVLLDVMMPDMDGPTTLERLRQDERTRDVPVVFMTAKVQRTEVERYMRLGAAGVVAKPFDPMQLAAEVRRVVGSIAD
jgi:two-component system cell cycle response regulator